MSKNKLKQLSIPQLVILLDVLFIFLFILIIKETPPKTKIILPEKKLAKGGFLSYEYEKGKFLWYDPTYQRWTGAEKESLIDHFNSVGKFVLMEDCNRECIDILKKNYNLRGRDKNISIVITNELYDQIARITYIACQTKKEFCGDIIFPITVPPATNKNLDPDWTIDKKELFLKNPFLKNIPGMLQNF